jgi:hypothetical protein
VHTGKASVILTAAPASGQASLQEREEGEGEEETPAPGRRAARRDR